MLIIKKEKAVFHFVGVGNIERQAVGNKTTINPHLPTVSEQRLLNFVADGAYCYSLVLMLVSKLKIVMYSPYFLIGIADTE